MTNIAIIRTVFGLFSLLTINNQGLLDAINSLGPSKEACPRRLTEAMSLGRTCGKQCISDADCKSRRKRCLCDGVCGLSCIKSDTECTKLDPPENGQLKILGGYFGARAYYECDEDFRLVGVDQRICQPDGTWSATAPQCRKAIYCEAPPYVQNAKHNGNNNQKQFEVDSQLQYSCQPGYTTIGFVRAKCIFYNGTAHWFGPDVECTPISCGDPGHVMNGYREGESYTYGSRIRYKCMDGYEISGRNFRVCKENGQWSGILPTCTAVHCSYPEDPINGQAIYNSIAYNSVVSYECRYGYTLVGSSRRRCSADKQWTGEKPICKGVPTTSKGSEIDCGNPGPLYNGWLEGTSTNLGSVINFCCQEGMKFEGVATFTSCQEDGRWSNPLPKCLAPCIVPDVEHGRTQNYTPGERVAHGQEISIDCRDRYELTYNVTPIACDNGTWTIMPKCAPARCKALPSRPRNGIVIAPKTEHGMRAKFKCKDGYTLRGNNLTECYFGNWTGDTPHCVEVYCGFPGSIEDGKVLLVGNMGLYDYRPYVRKVTNNRQIIFECKKGYTLIDGPPGATCVGGLWSPKQRPRCVPGKHPRLRWYRRKRDTVLTPRKRSKTRRKERGNRMPCEPLADVPHTKVRIIRLGETDADERTIPHGTEISVTCSRGYSLNVKANETTAIKCIRGRWKPRIPQCTSVPCKVPYIQNGAFIHHETVVPEESTLAHGETIKFTCITGYQLQGAHSVKCWLGEWAIDKQPQCTPVPCELPHITNGQYNGGYRAGLTIAHGSIVEFDCERDYEKAINRLITCHMGELKPRDPACRHHTVQVINVTRKNAGFQETDVHFKSKNSDDSDISAIDFPASTSKHACSPPDRVQNALVYREGAPLNENERRFPDSSEVHFNCITGITGERSSWKIVCNDGTWIGMPHKCETGELYEEFDYLRNKSCIYRNSEPNLVTFLTDMKLTDELAEFPPGTELVSRCSDIGKYALIGSVRRRCINGEWDGDKPTCFGLSQLNDYALEKPPTILFRHQLGPIAQSNDGKLIVYPSTILHLECLWIRKYGTPQWKVNHSYRKYPEGWTTEPKRDPKLEYRLSIYHAQRDDSGLYTCITPIGHRHSVEIVVQAVQCPRLPERPGLHISNSNTKMNTKVVFSCKNGNALIGPEQATCLPSGNWSAPIPVCESVRCPDTIPLHDRSLRMQIFSREVGGKAMFSCAQGHGLRGPTETFCESSGTWSQPMPTCEEVHCPTPTIPEYGYAQGSGNYKAGDVVQFNCNQGFMIDGQPIIVCQENGRWSGPVPKCVQACTYPGTTAGSTLTPVKFFYNIGETVTFDCAANMELRGARMLRCQSNGMWSNTVPLCHGTVQVH